MSRGLSIFPSLPKNMHLASFDRGGLYRHQFERVVPSKRHCLEIEMTVARASLRAHARRILCRPLPRRRKHTSGR